MRSVIFAFGLFLLVGLGALVQLTAWPLWLTAFVAGPLGMLGLVCMNYQHPPRD